MAPVINKEGEFHQNIVFCFQYKQIQYFLD